MAKIIICGCYRDPKELQGLGISEFNKNYEHIEKWLRYLNETHSVEKFLVDTEDRRIDVLVDTGGNRISGELIKSIPEDFIQDINMCPADIEAYEKYMQDPYYGQYALMTGSGELVEFLYADSQFNDGDSVCVVDHNRCEIRRGSIHGSVDKVEDGRYGFEVYFDRDSGSGSAMVCADDMFPSDDLYDLVTNALEHGFYGR